LVSRFWKNVYENSVKRHAAKKYNKIEKQCIDPKTFEAEEIKH
jgi:hypothetical protein